MVLKWLNEDHYEPEDRTHLNPNSSYLAVVKVSENQAFNVLFPKDPLDKVIIIQVASMDGEYKKAYRALPALDQNRFYFDLKISLLQLGVIFSLEKGVRTLESVQVNKVIYFDGLTKDRFFDAVFTVTHAIEVARTKLGQFRDSILPSQAGQYDDWKGTI
jgi:hypothetical protein